jgi:hypothetical protein
MNDHEEHEEPEEPEEFDQEMRVDDAINQVHRAIQETVGDDAGLRFQQIEVIGYGLIAIAEAIREQTDWQRVNAPPDQAPLDEIGGHMDPME